MQEIYYPSFTITLYNLVYIIPGTRYILYVSGICLFSTGMENVAGPGGLSFS